MQFYRNMVDQSRRDAIRLKNMQEREIQMERIEIKQVKKDKDFDKEFERDRPLRIDSWRKFSEAGTKKKKKKKDAPLGAVPF
jgi:hypothetical protein